MIYEIKQKAKKYFSNVKKRIAKASGCDVSYIYDEKFANRPWRDKGYKNDFKNIIMNVYSPERIVDVGCGTGDLLYPFMKEGVDIIGIDGSKHCYEKRKIPKEKFILSDIRYENLSLGRFDLCMCLEVAEHIEEKHSNTLVNTLTNLSENIVFTAATPGQGGVNHVNEKPRSWWISKFNRVGYKHKESKAKKISDSLRNIDHEKEHDRKSIKNYIKNMMVFERG